MKAAIVQDIAEEVLLGRDVPLHKHMMKRLPKGEQLALLRQLGRDDKVQLKERPEDAAGMQEDIPDAQGGDPIEGQASGEEITRDKDGLLGIEFPFDEELFGKPGKLRAHLTRAEKRRHNQQWPNRTAALPLPN